MTKPLLERNVLGKLGGSCNFYFPLFCFLSVEVNGAKVWCLNSESWSNDL